ncbi:5-methyltetrahydropteroyltriglutamate--homocysteine S-methyltransferase [bacterium]|jgi:5-methyltetrahydropteroyltriglutamate--homocysteine methyltransferase|nr:5-methyltetrahydropteroyltriglutamate--homocysteine S-methyltransferase [bacterium]
MAKITAHGYPKMGPDRETKKAIEAYWKGTLSKPDLLKEIDRIQIERLTTLKNANLDSVPSNDFSMYDIVLDTCATLGVVPDRYNWTGSTVDIDTYFAMARGRQDAVACEMTKFFDTNYHYIVPELGQPIRLVENRPLKAYQFAKEQLGLHTKPVLVGPFTFVYLAKIIDGDTSVKATESPTFSKWVNECAVAYNQLLKELQENGVTEVQIDEPALVMDISTEEVDTLIAAYQTMTEGVDLSITVQTYYESLSHFKRITTELPVNAIGLDFVVNADNMTQIQAHGFPSNKQLQAGLIDGRSIWKTNIQKTKALYEELSTIVDKDRIVVSNAAPLFHLPVSTEPEKGHIQDDVLALLAFANERLQELGTFKAVLENKEAAADQTAISHSPFANTAVQEKLAAINEAKIVRTTPFKERYLKQMEALDLPLFPTTTIGSFPQTAELRKKRAGWKNGSISNEDYETYINTYIRDIVKLQEDLDLDVLVHGEPERTDMVEFFGQQMEGFAFSKKAWVQSYGSRCVRPPIIFGDVSRPNPMTVKETVYAQEQTDRPMKGMLTGAVTILNWSFYRKDITKKDIAYQIGLALENEVLDLEKAGITIIQIDEPAFREGLPLKAAKQKEYLEWAVNAFRLSYINVQDTTQIHTHMCYSEFNEIMPSIHAMDADVISIEASRSKGDILESFEAFDYDLGIGLGVYDIHSPRIPSEQEMLDIAQRSVKVLGKELVWINPDCGLKTRGFEETKPALESMVKIAKSMRTQYPEETVTKALVESATS